MTFCTGQLHPFTIYRTGFFFFFFFLRVRCSVVQCYYVFLLLIPWQSSISLWQLWILVGFLWLIFILNYMFRHSVLSIIVLEMCTSLMFSTMDIPFEYLIKNVTFRLIMSYLNSLLGYSRLCNWLSLRCLVPWINHLPSVCWSTFGNNVWNDSGFVNLT